MRAADHRAAGRAQTDDGRELLTGSGTHVLVLPGGGYSTHVPHEAEPIVEWLEGLGIRAGVFRYPLHARHPVPFEDLGVLRIRRDETAAGIEALDHALVVYAEGEASWDAGRVRSRLREHGVRRRLAPRERPETGWAALTDTELAVARLVAQGLTNRAVAGQLFVSPHTVSSHLRSIFAKLGVNSRVALTRLAAENDQAPVAARPEPAG